MQIARNKVVSIHYTVTGEDGAELETTRNNPTPWALLIGHQGVVPGLEAALMGRSVGDTFEVTLAPEQAFGLRDDNRRQRVPKKHFRDGDKLQPGMVTVLSMSNGQRQQVTVRKLGLTVVDVDLNHPMAGRTLTFNVEVTDIRDADQEELAHRHAHGPGTWANPPETSDA